MKRLACGCVLVLFVLCGIFAQADLQPIVNVRITKTEPITLKQLKSLCEVYQRQVGGTPFTVEQKKEILDAMIDEKLVVQDAQKAGVTVSDAEANQFFLQNISAQVGQAVTEQEFAAIVKEQTGLSLDAFMRQQVGMSTTEYKAYLKNQLIAQRYVMTLKQADLAKAMPTDAEVRSFYELNRSAFAQNDVIKIFLVVVPKESNASGAKTKANDLFKQYQNKNTSISEMKIKSQNADSGFQAGDMYISKTNQASQQLGMDYSSLLGLFSKDTGYVSELIETDKDFQFFVIQEKYPAKLLELSDVVQPGTTVTIYEYIKNQLLQQKQGEVLARGISELVEQLRKGDSVQFLKNGAALDSLLNW